MTRTQIDCFGLTDRGKVRDANEDHFVVASMRKRVTVKHTSLGQPGLLDDQLSGAEGFLLAVADGVGGRPGGELASSQAVEGLLDFVGRASGCFNKVDIQREHELLEELEGEIRATHESILDQNQSPQGAPATTLTLAMIVTPRVYLVHVGDSRAYYLRRGRLHQITRDQTVGEYMVDIGAWTDTQAARAPAASALASAIGGSELTPVVGLVDLEPGDVLVLCTDGLNRHVKDDEITATIGRNGSAESIAKELVAKALDGGGEDNVTVIVARMPNGD